VPPLLSRRGVYERAEELRKFIKLKGLRRFKNWLFNSKLITHNSK